MCENITAEMRKQVFAFSRVDIILVQNKTNLSD